MDGRRAQPCGLALEIVGLWFAFRSQEPADSNINSCLAVCFAAAIFAPLEYGPG